MRNFMIDVFNDYRKVAEESSGSIALSVMQALVMAGCIVKRDVLHSDVYYWILTGIAVLATIGLFASLCSVGAVIIDFTPKKSLRRYFLFWLFYPVSMGVFIAALATLKSLYP